MAVKYGTTSSDTVNGTTANDTIYGWASGGNASSASGNDKLYGNDGDDILWGGTGDDNLDGDAGKDTLCGGQDNDILDGDLGDDKLYGEFGNDTLLGKEGNDTLDGSAGNDTLDGGLGNDNMSGGTGDDTYLIDSTTDIVFESFNQGIDTVQTATNVSAFSYKLAENVENLEAGSLVNSFKGFGNALNNKLIAGYSGNYNLYGGDGNDYIEGGDKSSNRLFGEAGNDTLVGAQSPFCVNYLDGGVGNDTLTGGFNGAGDTLLGGAGNDEITGLFGDDMLTGGTGADRFIFNGNDSVDTITDFSVVDDTIVVSAASFRSGLTPGAAITSAQFAIGAAAAKTSDRFIYNKATGALYFDTDGTGATEQVQLAGLPTGLAMTNADIFVIA